MSRSVGTVRVALGERSYPIRIGHDTLPEAGEAIAAATGARQVAVVTVPEVGRRYAPRLLRGLRAAGLRAHRIDVPDGDTTKNLRQVSKLYDFCLEKGLDRSSALIALGGGVVGDLTGFVAATYLRGIPFVQVPTTLLAMIDSSVGGKVGVNVPQGKNLIGAFHQPRLVWVDTATLKSLPPRQRAAGMAEIIKAGAIWDARFFGSLERTVGAALALEPDALFRAIERACRIKAEVVRRDEREREGGVRVLLNFGHTLGHAIEKLCGYRKVHHGEAVAMGMTYGARRSEALGLAPAGTADRLEALLRTAGLPTELPDFPRRVYLEALRVDKKRRDRHIDYVVLRRIGLAETRPLTPQQIWPARR